ncbi:MAG: glucose-1-phosphate cytidylyltransferase [Elusimicrobia bacterium]|nr:glucose-1-phosphate cytidylyltransferase [Elusimicrobiota bacterium]
MKNRASNVKVVILAGGLGSRLSEETTVRPKPMVEIGGKPILWHILNLYALHGHRDFIIACGYKGEVIKEYFHNFFVHNSDFTVQLKSGTRRLLDSHAPDWSVSVVDTGLSTMTGGRLSRLKAHLGSTFMVTYGDGVGSVDIGALLKFHRAQGKLATVTAVRPPARFGGLELSGTLVRRFTEKPQTGEGWINGGFFVFEPGALKYMASDASVLEREPLERLARDGELAAFRHEGFWQPMDTLRDKQLLEQLWTSGKAPWKAR